MRRKAKSATPQYLEAVGLWYIERYGGSEKAVRRALNKRVRRAIDELEEDPRQAKEHADRVIAKLKRLGYINDERLAKALVGKLRRRGLSHRGIVATLRRRGITGDLAEEQLTAHNENGRADLEAAYVFARKRRIGPYRRKAIDLKERQRELGKMARAGFSFDVCQHVLAGPAEEHGA